jgi:nucleotide-binding universal stress UspA family protein
VLSVTGHHADAGQAIVEAARRTQAAAVIVGRPAGHGGEPGAPSLATILTEEAPCDVLVVAPTRVPLPV